MADDSVLNNAMAAFDPFRYMPPLLRADILLEVNLRGLQKSLICGIIYL
jgi:hypothetical protein